MHNCIAFMGAKTPPCGPRTPTLVVAGIDCYHRPYIICLCYIDPLGINKQYKLYKLSMVKTSALYLYKGH